MKQILSLVLFFVLPFGVFAGDSSALSDYEQDQFYWYWYEDEVKDVYLEIEDKLDKYLVDNFLPVSSEHVLELDAFSKIIDEYVPKKKYMYIYQALQVKIDDFIHENKMGYLWLDIILKEKEHELSFINPEEWTKITREFSELICMNVYGYGKQQDEIIEWIWKNIYDKIISEYDFELRNSFLCVTEKKDSIFVFYSTVGPSEGSWSIWITWSFIKSYDWDWIFLEKFTTSRLSFKWFLKSPAYIWDNDIIYAEGFNRYSSESLIK